MAWETRKNRLYYYRAHRDGDRVVKQYVGCGPAAQAAARADLQRRMELKAARQESQAAVAELSSLLAPLAEFDRACNTLTQAALTAAGFREHRGSWRKRRIPA